jgi:AraC family transcriptional regulator of adaptative response/methylated-DNA-[protein]-cysteine methyltransferase
LEKNWAEIAHLSPFHFQRMFTDWAGTSPKKFLQYISLQYAKSILKQKDTTLADAAFHTGLSGTGRLHDLFVQFEGMTPGEYKNGGSELAIDYSFSASPFGKIIVASTGKGICYMAFIRNETETLHELMQHFPKAKICERQVNFKPALGIFRAIGITAGH